MINSDEIKEIVSYSKALNVLYVEDSKEIREQTFKMFNNFFHNITLAVDGKDGLEKFKTNNFDLIFSDLNMPVMNGIDMIKSIRKSDNKVFIIVMSAENEFGFKDISKKYDIIDYIKKPIALDKFVKILYKIKDIKTKHD